MGSVNCAVNSAGPEAAADFARQRGLKLADLPRIKGWGHRTAPLLLERKLELSAGQPLLFPHVRDTFDDALRRAGMQGIGDVDGLETHDCFTVTEYMAIDHSGLTEPGQSWQAIEAGRIAPDGDFPVNPSGGLIGLGHPVGCTGVRMVLDCARQVSGQASGRRRRLPARRVSRASASAAHSHRRQLAGDGRWSSLVAAGR